MKIVTVVKDAAYRENLEKLLRKLGQEYKSAETVCGGQEGYNLIKEEVPDLIIADISLSRMGGLVMLKKLRRENTFKSNPACRKRRLTSDQTGIGAGS